MCKSAFFRSLFVMISLAVIMLFSVVKYHAAPHIPMLSGATIAGIMAFLSGKSWNDIQEGMIKGIYKSLPSLIILLLIGVLTGVWILDGVVPAMVYYGLAIISPQIFLPSAMVLCALLSMVAGSWGTIGTIGLAFIGLAQAMGLPLSIAAGAIVSGSHLGDRLSPLSDTANLSSAITGVDIFDNVKHKIYIPLGAFLTAGLIYLYIGFRFVPDSDAGNKARELQTVLAAHFPISFWSFFPLILLVVLMFFRFPAIPSITASILAASIQSLFQGSTPSLLLDSCMYGYTSQTNNELLDKLLSTGGLTSMLFSLSMILCAMMFGGIMEHTGQMEALMSPLLKHIRGFGMLVTSTIASCVLVNIFIPEQYISISIPGSLFLKEYESRSIRQKELAFTVGAGGSATSSLVPWNTCGVFITGVLGVSPLLYGPFAFYNILLVLFTILAAFGGHFIHLKKK